ncbi:putative glycoside hydrolase [Saccharophagus degradans]|uniref:ExoP galactose-binding-like domain-containing protein n=1 Tax=Saccharophagus degradans (strain 2-40 / ATCC 43961 / DSM 17024) TaxID=203122 RepID=Q21ER8_SACD2|nr:putative glycoside hydrolase [Saccharophagus degradans]ABD82811.1 hypothetical protein Sde_3556 [Saccharophagus degradans 2-40]
MTIFVVVKRFLFACTFLCSSLAVANSLDPTFVYFTDGKVVGARGISVGDSKNWSVPVVDLTAKSESGKLIISPTTYKRENDALRAEFTKKKTQASLAIYGPEIDLAALEDKVALSLWVKVDKISSSPVHLGMDCGWPCRAEIDIRKNLRKFPRKEWFNFAIPLNCLSNFGSGESFDLSKINGPFVLSTEGRLDISIADIRLGLLPEGDPGCAKVEE